MSPADHAALPGLRARARATIRVPATSANLGPGFDSLGLALAVYDELSVEVTAAAGLVVEVDGEGAGEVPLTEEHLVVRGLRAGLEHAGAGQPGLADGGPGLRLHCANRIPHGRGLGSSASAVVAGLVAARALLARPELLDDDEVLLLANRFEGHPDNAAAAVFGGCTVSWREPGGRPRAAVLPICPDLTAAVCVPAGELPTAKARAMLPASVPHGDAAFNAGRAALLVEAVTRRPELLFAATEDRLHQQQRSIAMPDSAKLLGRLRRLGAAAVVSGAGPALLVLGTGDGPRTAVDRVLAEGSTGWSALHPRIDTLGALVTTEGD